MHFEELVTGIGVAVVWVLKEIGVSVWKHRDGYSIGDKIDYLFKREKYRENVNDYLTKHPSKKENKDD